ncbi:MAG: HD domain-containing protein, partial [Spirochaetales bacterium]|nr:HD domain-containing protein [Spirochaetales bacterium]
MKTLFTTDYKNYKPEWPSSCRPSARAVILIQGTPLNSNPDDSSPVILKPQDKIALVYAKNLGYYKFPGGGINKGEDNITALIREVQEETGLELEQESITEYGVVTRIMQSEMFPETIFIQDSFHYLCRVKTDSNGMPVIKKQELDAYESEEGFELRIVSIQEAVEANVNFKSSGIKYLDMVARENHVMTLMCGLPELMPRAYAESLLEHGVSKNPGPWREHSYAVAEAAEKLAQAVNKKSGTKHLDPNLAYTLGLLHDIGRQEGHTYIAHVYDGYHYLKNLGYDTAAKICLTHSFNLKTIDDYIGKVDISDQQLQELKDLLEKTEFDDYDRMIQLLDSTCGADGTKNLEQRMNDVKERYGYYPQAKWNKN